MNKLLAEILDAHGGVDRWRNYAKVDATIVSGGGFFALKGFVQDPSPRRMTVWLHEERSSVWPYRAPISARCSRLSGSPFRSSMALWSPSAVRPGTRLPDNR